jgi:carboxymethylenebutenolidase
MHSELADRVSVISAPSEALRFSSGGRPISIEHFKAPHPRPQPAVLLLHGADGVKAGRHYHLAAQVVAAAGYHAFLLHYLDRTGERRASYSEIGLNFPAWAETVRDALTFLHDHSAVDPKRLALIGTSLGAGLALGVAAKDTRVRALVSYFGFLPETVRDTAKRLPPSLVLHGARDSVIPVSNAHAIRKLLEKLNTDHEVHIYPDQGHSFQGFAQLDAANRTATFLHKHL